MGLSTSEQRDWYSGDRNIIGGEPRVSLRDKLTINIYLLPAIWDN